MLKFIYNLLEKLFAKVNVFNIFRDHLSTLKAYGSSHYSKGDLLLFFVLPLIFSFLLVFRLKVFLSEALVGTLITMFSIFAGLLFNLLVLMYDVVSSAYSSSRTTQAKILKIDLLEAVFFNVSFGVFLSLLGVVLVSVSTFFRGEVAETSFSLLAFYVIVLFTLTLFMILKRIHKVLSDEIKEQRRRINGSP